MTETPTPRPFLGWVTVVLFTALVVLHIVRHDFPHFFGASESLGFHWGVLGVGVGGAFFGWFLVYPDRTSSWMVSLGNLAAKLIPWKRNG